MAGRRVLGVAFACAACTSLGGLSGGTESAPDDAGSVDAAPADAGMLEDVGPAEADAPRGCAKSTAFFCDDFDRGAVGEGWSEVLLTDGGQLAFDTNLAVSPPRSLRSSVTEGGAFARLRHAVPASAPRVRVSFSVSGGFATAKANDSWTLAQITCLGSSLIGSTGGVSVDVGFGGPRLTATYAGSAVQESDYGFGTTDSTWRRVAVDATWGNPGHLVAVVDGLTVVDTPAPVGCLSPTSIDVIVGVRSSMAAAMSFDDVTIETAF
jgi:hypothetical protein